jgi:oligopeptide/dipeptide ABC transporter ATP-binding protein
VAEARVVNDVSFTISPGETLGLVGETGCGKTVLLRTILLVDSPTDGEIIFEGQNLTALSSDELILTRRDIQLIFQDPAGSLHPRITVEESLIMPLNIHGVEGKRERRARVKEVMELVGLDPAFCTRYPHQLSGGQRQRVGVARALMLNPKLILCDEPISALDVSLQAQVINLFMDLQDKFGLTYLFVAHDLAVLRQISRQIAVMYLGRIIEHGSVDDIYSRAQHPYTRALLLASPSIRKGLAGERITQEVVWGEVPSAARPPAGCAFHPRCRHAFDRCSAESPPLRQVASGHLVSCFLASQD